MTSTLTQLAPSRREWFAFGLAAFLGLWLPALGLLVPYSGLTLSLAALGSVAWLVAGAGRRNVATTPV